MQLEALRKTSKGTPPRLAIILNTDGTRAGCAVICEAQLVPVSSQVTEALSDLMCIYYVWGLSYPKHFQLLGFVQHFVFEDTDNKFSQAQDM